MDKILDFYRLQETDSLYMYWLKEILVAVTIFAFFWILAKTARYALNTWGGKFTSFTRTDLDDRILRRITPSVSLLVVFAGLHYAAKSLPLTGNVQLAASGVIFVANVIILTNMAYRTTDELLVWYASKLSGQEKGALDRQLIPLAEKLFTIFLMGAALIIILKHFNYDILSLVTALGIGSLAIGMAAKDTLANMISGFTIMIDRPFRIGDRILVAKDQWGDVMDIGLRSTKIKTADSTLLIIPNSTLCNSNLVNMAFPEAATKGRINIGIAYGSDVERVKGLLTEIALETAEVLKEPRPEAFLVSFGDSALNMALFFWTASYTDIFPATDKINTAILKRFKECDIDIPYPTSTVLLQKDA